MSQADRRRWIAKVRANPKGALEADLVVATIGLIVAVMGGLISAAGIHPAWQNIHNNAPTPVFGSIVLTAGLYIVAIGLVLILTNVFVWVTGHRRSAQAESETHQAPQHEVVACSICGECKPLGHGVLAALGVCVAAVALGGLAAALGGSVAIMLGGLALLVFVAGVWSLTITGGLLLLVHWAGRRERRRPRRPDLRQLPARPHRRA